MKKEKLITSNSKEGKTGRGKEQVIFAIGLLVLWLLIYLSTR